MSSSVSSDQSPIGLVGDVGGTNARFALARRHRGRFAVEHAASFHAASYPTGDDALRAYLAGPAAGVAPRFAVIAAAGPIENGQVLFTNNTAWSFSESGLAKAGGFQRLRLINDFTAQALSIEHLQDGDVRAIGEPTDRTITGNAAILGPGTGFGAGVRVLDGRGRAILTGEAGHCGISPGDETEVEIVRLLMARFGRVSVERILSGPGLVNLHQALAQLRGETAAAIQPDEITRGALAGDPLCRVTVDRFCAILGSVAGDFALAYGAKAGVYVSGGIAPVIIDLIPASAFRSRFEAKGRMSGYLTDIPTFVVLQSHSALIGAASLLDAMTETA
jgi:glucokinase